jgi:hypothetical protein
MRRESRAGSNLVQATNVHASMGCNGLRSADADRTTWRFPEEVRICETPCCCDRNAAGQGNVQRKGIICSQLLNGAKRALLAPARSVPNANPVLVHGRRPSPFIKPRACLCWKKLLALSFRPGCEIVLSHKGSVTQKPNDEGH